MHNDDYRNGETNLESEKHRNKACLHLKMIKASRNGFNYHICANTNCKLQMSQIEYVNHLAKLKKLGLI